MRLTNRFSELVAIKSRKEGQKVTIGDVAEATQLSRKSLESWANNDIQRFDAHTIIALCQYFNCTVGDLFILEED